jgi:hypothetical protein
VGFSTRVIPELGPDLRVVADVVGHVLEGEQLGKVMHPGNSLILG